VDRPFAALHRLVAERHHALSGVICIFVAWDDARRALLQHLRTLGVPALVLLMTEGEAEPSDETLGAAGVRRLVRGRVAEGLARL
jgi:hypothetical protein